MAEGEIAGNGLTAEERKGEGGIRMVVVQIFIKILKVISVLPVIIPPEDRRLRVRRLS